MSGAGYPAAVSSTCPACGAGMEFDPNVNVLRCPYCRHEMVAASRLQEPVRPPDAGDDHVVTISYVAPTLTPTARVARVVIPLLGVAAVVGVLVYTALPHVVPDREVALGAPARAGSFEVTAVSIDCSKQSIVRRPDDPTTSFDESETEKADGTFCLIPLKVTNVGDKTETYSTFDIQATSATERVFTSNYMGERYVNKDKTPLSEPIDPGVTVTQTLVYDVPKGSSIASLRVYNNYDGPSVKVKIS